MIVVSDTSPIRALHHLNLLNLLPDLFGEVIVPFAVEAELIRPRGNSSSVDVAAFPFIRVQAASDQTRVDELLNELDRGEAEALALAIEISADVVLIDESRGRRKALDLHLAVTGLVGVLIEAKLRGFIPAVIPLIDRLRDELNFWIGPELRRRVAVLAGEPEN